ncbi:MAG: DUF167 domain-containing protein [bacterium]
MTSSKKKKGKESPTSPPSDRATISVRIQPNAAKSELVEIRDEVLKIRISAPPVDGKANKEFMRFLARVLKVSASQISIVGGQTGRSKVVRILGIDQDTCWQRLTTSLRGDERIG